MKRDAGTDFPYLKEKYRTVALPRWKYPLLKSYNGFTGLERVRAWQLSKWAIMIGWLRAPSICSISGAVGEYGTIQYHSENYYDPLGPYPIHSTLHRTLHLRFRDPSKWALVVDRYRHNAENLWFADLPMVEPDYASELRKQGINGQTMLKDFIRNLPQGCPKPYGRLHTAKDFDETGKPVNANVSALQKPRILREGARRQSSEKDDT